MLAKIEGINFGRETNVDKVGETNVHNGCPSPVGGLALLELFTFGNT